MWIDKTESMPNKGQMVLLFWDSGEIGCFRSTGGWNFEFLWASDRFGHRSEDLATRWMPFDLPGEYEAKWPKKVTCMLSEGEVGSEVNDTDDLLYSAGNLLDDSCSGEVLGEVVFLAEDGKVYTMSTEAHIREINPGYLQDILNDLGHGDHVSDEVLATCQAIVDEVQKAGKTADGA